MTSQNAQGEPSYHKSIQSSSAARANPQDTCTICLEHITERAITSPCNHALFDYLCLLTWLLEHDAKCPLCKAPVKQVAYDFASATEYKAFNIPPRIQCDPRIGRGSGSSDSSRHCAGERRSAGTRRHRSTSLPQPTPSDLALEWRKYVYLHDLYSLHVGANKVSGYCNFTPQAFAASASLQRRARKWIRRELMVFEFLEGGQGRTRADGGSRMHEGTKGSASKTRFVPNAEYLLEYIVALLRNVDVRDSSGRAEDLLTEFLGRQYARLFLHELEAWLRSPFESVEEWDAHVQYLSG